MAYQTPPRRILIIDDNRDAADLTAEVLELYGHIAAASYGGEQAVGIAISFAPDVVLLDLGMPGMDGYAVAVVLRQVLQLHMPIIIAYTAWNDEATKARTLSSGFDYHLVKPAKIELLLDVVSASTQLPNP